MASTGRPPGLLGSEGAIQAEKYNQRGKVPTVDEAQVMELAQVATDKMVARTGLQHLLESPATLWRSAHY